jgi:hypothetical protein
MLCIDVRASKNTAAQSNLPAVLRSLQRPNAKGFVEYLANQSSVSAILDQYCAPMGQVMELDNTRTNRTGQRFVRALYFSEVGTALPQHTPIRVGAKMGLRARDADTITIARALKTLPDWRNGSVGAAFSYVGAIGAGVFFLVCVAL